jgi:hypothetical protein
MGDTPPAGRRRAASDAAMSGMQEDVFLFMSYLHELIIAKICHEVKMTLLRRLGQPLRAGMTSDDVATIRSCPRRDVRRRRNRAFIRALQILIDEHRFLI